MDRAERDNKASDMGDRRRAGAKVRLAMFFKLLTASLINRLSRITVILLAVVIGASVVSGLASIYREFGGQLSRQLRVYGANLMATPKVGHGRISTRNVDEAARAFGNRLVGYSPYIYGRTRMGHVEAVLVGMRLGQLKKVSPYIKLRGAPGRDKNRVIVGQRLADRLGLKIGRKIKMTTNGKQTEVRVGELMESGGVEDGQVLMDLPAAQQLLGEPNRASLGYFSVVGQGSGLTADARRTGRRFSLNIEPITRISQAESQILERIKGLIYLVAGVILVTNILAVTTTMMAIIIERRREVALKKALGAANRDILSEFVGEGLLIGLIGGILGWLIGNVFAQWMGRAVFDAHISFTATTLLISIGVSLLISVVASVVPVRMALGVEPAIVLKGE